METPEFQLDDTVTYKPCEKEFKVKILEVEPNRYKDGRTFYFILGGDKDYLVGTWTSGQCLKESKYFEDFEETR